MQEHTLQNSTYSTKKPIGGWLWVIALILIASILSTLISLGTTIQELLRDDWNQYLRTSDEVLNTRISIYLYLIVSMVGTVLIFTWATKCFFQRKEKFISIFLGAIGFSMATEMIRLFLLNYYANLTDQDATSLDSNLVKVVIIGAIAGIYLNKGKRPQQTFTQ